MSRKKYQFFSFSRLKGRSSKNQTPTFDSPQPHSSSSTSPASPSQTSHVAASRPHKPVSSEAKKSSVAKPSGFPSSSTGPSQVSTTLGEPTASTPSELAKREGSHLSGNKANVLWKNVFEAYTKSGGDLQEVLEFASKKPDASVVSVAVERFDAYRTSHEKFYRSAQVAMQVGQVASSILGEAVKGTFPPAAILCAISSVFFQACKGVTETYDTIEKMLSDFKAVMNRLHWYENDLDDALLEELATSLQIMLEVFGFITNAAHLKQWTRVKHFFENVSENGTWNEKLDALDRCMKREELYTAARTSSRIKDIECRLTINNSSPKDAENVALDKRKKMLKPKDGCGAPFLPEIDSGLVHITRNWIEDKNKYKDWQKGKTPVLLVSGPTGCGKTHLCGNIMTRLKEQGEGEDIPLVPFFGNEGMYLADVLRTWAFELSRQSRDYQKYVDGQLSDWESIAKSNNIKILWERLFFEYQKQRNTSSGGSQQPVYLVLDGLDAKNTDHQHINTFLGLVKVFQEYFRSENPTLKLKTTQTSIFRILIMARLDQVDSEVHRGLNHHEVTREDYKNDIIEYIEINLESARYPGDRRKLAKRLGRVADNFSSAFVVINLIKNDHSEKNIQRIISNPPIGNSGWIQSIINPVENASADIYKVLNTLLVWLVNAEKDTTLDDFDCIFKIRDRYGQGVSDLKGIIGTYPSIFRFKATEASVPEHDLPISNAIPTSHDEILSTKLRNDRKHGAHFKNVTVVFSQESIKDYFQNNRTPRHRFRVDQHKGNIEIACFCMSLFCDDSVYGDWGASEITDYAKNHFYIHVKKAGLKNASRSDKERISKLLNLMFFDKEVLKRWTAGAKLPDLSDNLFSQTTYTDTICDWLNSIDKTKIPIGRDSMPESSTIRSEEAFELLKPLATCLASQWLGESSSIAACEQYKLLGPYVEKVDARTESNETSNKLVSHELSNHKAERIRRVARHFKLEENSTWHLRLAQVLKAEMCLGECKRELEAAIQQDPGQHLASFELTEACLDTWDFEKARRVYDECLERLTKINATDAVHLFEIAPGCSSWFLDEKTIQKLELVLDCTRESPTVDEAAHYACFKVLVDYHMENSGHATLCKYLRKLSEETMPTGESRLARYLMKEREKPLIFKILPENSAYKMRDQSDHMIFVLRHCLAEALLVRDDIFVPIFQEYLANFLFQTAGEEREAIELWNQVGKAEGGTDNTSVIHRAKANATRHLCSIYFTRALVAQTLHEFDEASKHVKSLSDFASKAVDPTRRKWWFAHCSALMFPACYLRANRVNEAHEIFKDHVSQAVKILEDQDPSNDVDGFLILAETLMTTGVDDEDTSAAMTLFLQYRRCGVSCDACGQSSPWRTYQVCRFCKVDLCDGCHARMRNGQLDFPLCHFLHEFFKPVGDDPGDLVEGFVRYKGEVIYFEDWLKSLKEKWELEQEKVG